MPKLKKRPDGRYSRQIYLGIGPDGKRKYKTVYGATPKEVDDALLEVKLRMKKGLDVSAEMGTFGDQAAGGG